MNPTPMESKHKAIIWCVGLVCWAAINVARAKNGAVAEPVVNLDFAKKEA